MEKTMNRLIIALALSAALAGCNSSYSAAYQEGPAMSHSTSVGDVLTNAEGMTLYSFDKDSNGMSACTGQCAVNWPPFMAGTHAKAMDEWTLIKREDGSMQWAYDGKPLYLFIGDKAPGDVNGDGLKGVWHVVPAHESSMDGDATHDSGGAY